MLPTKLFGMRSAILGNDALKILRASRCSMNLGCKRERPWQQRKEMTMRQLNKYAEIAMVSQFLGFMIDAYDMAPVLGVYFHRFSVFDHDGCATSRVS
jgi:hypothetical protein